MARAIHSTGVGNRTSTHMPSMSAVIRRTYSMVAWPRCTEETLRTRVSHVCDGPVYACHNLENEPDTVRVTAAASGKSAAGTSTNTTTTSTRGPAFAARSCTIRARSTRARSA
jgi:hypothetical protein